MALLGKRLEAPPIQSRSMERLTTFTTQSVWENIAMVLSIAPELLEIFIAWWPTYPTLEVSVCSSSSSSAVDLPKISTKTIVYSTTAFAIPRCRLWSSWLGARMWDRLWMCGGRTTSPGLHKPECRSMVMPACAHSRERRQKVVAIAMRISLRSRKEWSRNSSFIIAKEVAGKRYAILSPCSKRDRTLKHFYPSHRFLGLKRLSDLW